MRCGALRAPRFAGVRPGRYPAAAPDRPRGARPVGTACSLARSRGRLAGPPCQGRGACGPGKPG